jgi:hypothetical protein
MSDNTSNNTLTHEIIIPDDQIWLYNMLIEQKKMIKKLDRSIQLSVVILMILMFIVIISR